MTSTKDSFVFYSCHCQLNMEELSFENISNNSNNSMISNHIPVIERDEIEFTCTRLLEKLEKILTTVRFENNIIEKLFADSNNDFDGFSEISNELKSKLASLYNLSETHYCKSRNLKDFVKYTSTLLEQKIQQEYLQNCRRPIASHTEKELSLVKYLKKIQIEADEIKMMLEYSTCMCDHQCIQKGYDIYEETSSLIKATCACNCKIQSLMTINKIIPFIKDQIDSIDHFFCYNEIFPLKQKQDELSVFPLVSKLLTGELLGHEPIILKDILKPKKPIFITKIIKRKSNISPVL